MFAAQAATAMVPMSFERTFAEHRFPFGAIFTAIVT